MTIAWPAPPFPQVPLIGTTESPQPNVIRTQMDVGLPKVRARTTLITKNYDCSLILQQADFLTFRQFFESDTQGGALPFTWTEPSSGAAYTFRFLTVQPYANYGATDLWKVQFVLEKVIG